MQKKALSSVLCTLALCSVSLLVNGQSIADNTVTVTATRTEQLVKDVPTTTYVITSEDIEKHQYKTLEDALWQVPGVQFSSSIFPATYGKDISIRGSESRHVLILVDGKRIPSTLSVVDENKSVLQRYTLENVKQIEVIEGASSSLYGSEAMGGVINIITKDGSKPISKLGMQYSHHERNQANGFNINYSYDSGWHHNRSLAVSLGKNVQEASYDKGGTQQGYAGPRNLVSLTLGYKITPNDVLKASINSTQEYTKLYNPNDSFGVKLKEKQYHTNSYALEYKGVHGKTDMMLRAYATHFDYFKLWHFPGEKVGPFFSQQFAWDKNSVNSQIYEAQFSTAVNDQNLLTYGIEYRRTEGTSNLIKSDKPVWTMTYQGATKSGYKAHLNYYSIYLQDEYTSQDGRLILVPSIRYDGSNHFKGNLSPKIGVTYKLHKDFRIKTNYGTGYTMPRFRELYWNWEHFSLAEGRMARQQYGLLLKGNPDLKAETNNSFDIGIEKDFANNKGIFKLVYFHNDIKNFIDREYFKDSEGNIQVDELGHQLMGTFNIKHVRINGFTASVQYKLNDNLDISAAITEQNPYDLVEKERLAGKAKWVLQTGLNYHNNHGLNIVITGNGQFNFKKALGMHHNEISYGDYNYWSALITQKFGSSNIDAYIGIDNMFNNTQEERNIDGRSYRVGINYHF